MHCIFIWQFDETRFACTVEQLSGRCVRSPGRVTCRTATLKDTPWCCPSLQTLQIPVQSCLHGMWQNPGQNRGTTHDPRHRLPVSWCQVAQTPSDVLTDQSCLGDTRRSNGAASGWGFQWLVSISDQKWKLLFFFLKHLKVSESIYSV